MIDPQFKSDAEVNFDYYVEQEIKRRRRIPDSSFVRSVDYKNKIIIYYPPKEESVEPSEP